MTSRSIPPAEVVQQYDKLIHEVKRRCPRSTTVFVNRVPPRGHNGRIRQGINMVNTYLRNRGKRDDGVRYIDSCPHFPGQLKKDRLHFSKTGSRDYADKLACHLINFQVDTKKTRLIHDNNKTEGTTEICKASINESALSSQTCPLPKETKVNVSFFDKYTVSKSPADGHCFLHSIIKSMQTQMGVNVSITDLIKAIEDETMQHRS